MSDPYLLESSDDQTLTLDDAQWALIDARPNDIDYEINQFVHSVVYLH